MKRTLSLPAVSFGSAADPKNGDDDNDNDDDDDDDEDQADVLDSLIGP